MKLFMELFAEVHTLQNYIMQNVAGTELDNKLVIEADSERYKHLLHTSIICISCGARRLQLPERLSQGSHQKEIVLRVIERIQRREGIGKNVLTFGFGVMSDDPNAQISSMPNIEYRCPNHSVGQLQYNIWKTLLSRIGDNLMSHLLENTSIFMEVAPTCYTQITGTPVYELVPQAATGTNSKKQKRKLDHWSNLSRPTKKRRYIHSTPVYELVPQAATGTNSKKQKRKLDHWSNLSRPTKKRRYIHSTPVYELVPQAATGTNSKKQKRKLDHWSNLSRPTKKRRYIHKNQSRKQEKPKENRRKLVELKPYDYHQQIGRTIFFARAMQEKLPETFLAACGEDADRKQNVPSVLSDLAAFDSLLKKIVTNHRCCPYRGLLSHHCPVQIKHKVQSTSPNLAAPSFHRCSQTKGDETSCSILWYKKRKGQHQISTGTRLEDFVTHRQVFLFLRAVCLRTLPSGLLGSKHNQNVFFKNISRFIGLGRFDKLCLGQLMEKMRTRECPWLTDLPSNHTKLHLMSKLLLWLMEHFVSVVLKSFFYVTGTTAYRNRIFYYRKKVWQCLRSRAITAFLKKGMLKVISNEEVKQMIETGSVLGISSLRFLPKSKSLRPIVNMKSEGFFGQRQLVPVNKQLQNLLSILCYWKDKNPADIGCAKFGTDDIFESWKPFATRWRSTGCKPLYFVKVDISNCYDTIDQNKLYEIMERIVEKNDVEEYVIRRYAAIIRASGKPQRQFHRKVCSLCEYRPDFTAFVRSLVKAENLHDIIFVDQVANQYETPKALLQQLKNHLFNNILKIGQCHYRQCEGIPQGSVLSTLLCNFYYGHMEQHKLKMEEDDILMRVVDDSLLVTPDHSRAVHFLNYMLSGIPKFQCYINPDKSLANFEYLHETKGMVQAISDNDYFPWCGIVFNTKTLNVSVDYSRYTDLVVKDTMTLDLTQQPGCTMKRKLIYAMRSKCHKFYLDSELNSEATVIANCFKLFLLTAWKFQCYARHLPSYRCVEKNPHYFLEMIVDIARFLYAHATSCQKKLYAQQEKNSAAFQFPITCKACEWLCVKAFVIMLNRHASIYPILLKCLRKFRRLNTAVAHVELEALTGEEMLNQFNSIFT